MFLLWSLEWQVAICGYNFVDPRPAGKTGPSVVHNAVQEQSHGESHGEYRGSSANCGCAYKRHLGGIVCIGRKPHFWADTMSWHSFPVSLSLSFQGMASALMYIFCQHVDPLRQVYHVSIQSKSVCTHYHFFKYLCKFQMHANSIHMTFSSNRSSVEVVRADIKRRSQQPREAAVQN